MRLCVPPKREGRRFDSGILHFRKAYSMTSKPFRFFRKCRSLRQHLTLSDKTQTISSVRSSVSVLLILLFYFTATLPANAQLGYERIADITKKKDRSLLYEARQLIGMKNYDPAIPLLDELVKRNPLNIDLIYMRGTIQKDRKNYDAAISDLEAGIKLAADYNVGVFMELGKIYQLAGRSDEAIDAYEDFLRRAGPTDPAYKKVEDLLARARVARELMANPVPFNPEPLPGAVNTKQHDEYFPNLDVDGKRMIFVRNLNHNHEDFYESFLQEDGNWSAPQPLEYINSEFNEGAQTVSADGSLIVYTICNKPGGLGECDLYFTERKRGEWTPVTNMGRRVNSRFRETQPTLSADGKLLFFASNRPGGVGKQDLWGSARNEQGFWSQAVNLGKTINSAGDDIFPFFHPDGKTLYFTSDGHPGMGDRDLFLVRLQDNNTWTEPQNLGYPINTPDRETNIFIDLAGSRAFFAKEPSADFEGRNVDIYTFELPESARPIPATYVRATVVDATTQEPLLASVRLRPVSASTAPKTYQTDEKGSFLIVLPTGKNYALSVDQEGYFPYSAQFSLDEGGAPEEPFEVRIELQPALPDGLVKDQSIVLRNVLFESGSADLLDVSFPELDRLYDLLNRLPDLRIELGGHTDNVGSDTDNQILSEARAKAVRQYLMEKGIPAERLEYRGYGESQPVADNQTSAGRAENRRTEFKVL
ncbi:hypothetical protein CEQ90_04415 [Lewinellaceae bacterium SD302]|nr:hypothetical protein CEQ90_04415 [Lewinellaceae bacterium SD302]